MVPRSVSTLGRVGAVFGIHIVSGVGQRTHQRADAGGPGDGQLHRVADNAQNAQHIIERLLALGDGLLLLIGIVAVQGVQPAQIVLIAAIVLLVGSIVGVALPVELTVIVRQLRVILRLCVLLLRVELVDSGHDIVALTVVGVQRQPVEGRQGVVQRAHLLLVRLLGHTGRIAGAVAAGKGRSLCGGVRAGVAGVLGVLLGILAVERVLCIAVLEAVPLQQLTDEVFDAALIGALILARTVLLPVFQVRCCVGDALTGDVLRICQCILHLFAAVQSRRAVGGLDCRLGSHIFQQLLFFLFLGAHKFSFLTGCCSAGRAAAPTYFPRPDCRAHIVIAPASGISSYGWRGHPPRPCSRSDGAVRSSKVP